MQLMHKGVFTNCTYPWMWCKSSVPVVIRRWKGLVAEPPTNETDERYRQTSRTENNDRERNITFMSAQWAWKTEKEEEEEEEEEEEMRRRRLIELIGGVRGSGRDTTWSFLSVYFDWSLWEIKFFDEKQRPLRSIFYDVRIWKKWKNLLGNSW